MTNQKLRQAWQAALDIEPIMKTVAAGRSEFYRMDYNLIHQEMGAWHVKMQGLPWNEHNKEKAKKLLQEAGYKGEPIRFMTTQEYKWMYDFALVSKQQLEDIGLQHRPPGGGLGHPREAPQQPQGVRRLHDRHRARSTTRPTPTCLSCSWPGWTCDEQIQTIKTAMIRETDYKKRFALWEQSTRRSTRRFRSSATATSSGCAPPRKKVQGLNEKTERVRFWNVWLDK